MDMDEIKQQIDTAFKKERRKEWDKRHTERRVRYTAVLCQDGRNGQASIEGRTVVQRKYARSL